MKLKISMVILALVSIGCGMQTALPTSEPVAVIRYEPTPQPTATESHIEINFDCGVAPDFSQPVTVTTLGSLNVRKCPSTSSEVLGVLDAGAEIEAGAKITTTGTGYNCNRWRPLVWRGEVAWACSDWLSK